MKKHYQICGSWLVQVVFCIRRGVGRRFWKNLTSQKLSVLREERRDM
jgi:hypothetical protein